MNGISSNTVVVFRPGRTVPCLIGCVLFSMTLLASAGDAVSVQTKPWNPDERYFGTDSFVPDWRKAEEIDQKASECFLKNYWSTFKGDYDKGGTVAFDGA